MRAGHLLAAGVALVGLGMAVAFLGIVIPPLFVPGTRVILLGLLAAAAAGVRALLAPGPSHEPGS